MNLNWLRRFLPYTVKQNVKAQLGLPATRLHKDWKILEQIPALDSESIVLDIGARNGWFTRCWQDYDQKAVVHQFEPEPLAAEQLAEVASASNNIHFNAVGLSDETENKSFYYLPESAVSSSFLEPDEAVWKTLRFEHGDINESTLPVIRLDDYVDSDLNDSNQQQSIDRIRLIKIDVQGYELKTLKGAIKTLQNTDYVLVESAIKPLYHGAASFTQVHEFMVEQGFHLQAMRSWHRGNNVLMEADMLFGHDRLAGPVDESIDRIYSVA